MHAANLAAGVEDRDVEPDHQRLAAAGRAEVPAEPGLVVVRVDRPAEPEHQPRELVLHGADEPVDLFPPGGVDLAELTALAAALLSQDALTRVELGRRLAPRWPGHGPASLAYAATHLLPVVQVPPRGLWRSGGQATFFLAAAWLAGPGASPPFPAAAGPGVSPPDQARPENAREQLVLRYLAAYGPASVPDIQAWSGLSRLREVTDHLGTQLRTFTGPDGGQLLDLPDAPRPSPDVPAPPRFLPEYDNLLLSFAERSRVIPHRRPVPLPPGNGATGGTLLVDGLWQADWKITKGTLEIQPHRRLSGAEMGAIAAEGARLLDFAGPTGTGQDVRFAPVS